MIKTAFSLILICAAVLFGGKYYVENSYEQELDRVFTLSGIPARYKNIELGFDGSLSLNGLTVTPPPRNEDISFGVIKLLSSDRFAAFKGRKAFADGRFPEALSIKVSRMDFSAKLLEPAPGQEHCQGLDSTLSLYSEIGEERIRADMDVAVDLRDPYNAVVDLYYSDNLSATDLQLVLDVDGAERAITTGGEAPIREVSISSQLDPAAADSIAEYCANIYGVEKDVFFDTVVASPEFSTNSFGADLGDQFRQALVKYMRGGLPVKVKSEPSKQLLRISDAKFHKPRDVLRFLNLQVFVEGDLVPVAIVKEEVLKKVSKSEPARKLPSYEAVSVSQVARYVDRDVRVSRTKGRKPIRGRLVSVVGGLMAIEIYRFSGQMTLKVPVGDVSKLEVLSLGT